MLSEAAQDYIKAIWALRDSEGAADAGPVTTQRLADYLGVAAPSATAMVKKLAGLELLRHAPYHGVELTAGGEKVALEIIRHHRLVETYLARVLGVPWDKVHDEAEKWEHVLSEEVEARIAEALNYPTHDPHGAPIPSPEGTIAREACVPLSALPSGAERAVRRVNDDDGAVLRHLQEVGVVPGARVKVMRHEAAEGVLHLEVDGVARLLGTRPAREVWMADE